MPWAADLSSPYILAGLAFGTYALYKLITTDRLSSIPTVGPSAPLLSYIGALRLAKHGREMIQEGYNKHKGGVFKIALFDRWMVVFTGPKLIDEVRKMPDDKTSFMEAVSELIQSKYTFGRDLEEDPYHIDVIKQNLTRQIGSVFGDIVDEIAVAFDEIVPNDGKEWTSVVALPTMQEIVARVSSRVFVGLPMCRHQEYVKLAVRHTIDVGTVRNRLMYTPEFLRPIVGPFITNSKRTMAQGAVYLSPIIEQRQKLLRDLGDDWSDKPNDMLMWLIEEANARGQGLDQVVKRVMSVNFAAIHTSANSFTHALFHLAANSEYAQPLREEVEAVIKEDGWTKLSMQKMRKIDSFLRESQRVNGVGAMAVTRKALVDITLSNGTFIPAGTIMSASAISEHNDAENYPDPQVFNPWRFSDIREEDGEGLRHQFVSTSLDYIPFGHGKHACPGRFFAANELKAMLAHIVMNYDLKTEKEGVRPENVWFAVSVFPNPAGKVLLRKRRV